MKTREPRIVQEIPFQESTIETIDFAMYEWLKSLKLHCNTRDGWELVETVWASAERAHQSKRSRETRNKGVLNYPVISLERTGITKDPTKKGTAFGNVPHVDDEKGGASSIIVARRIKQDKTGNFANADAKRRYGQINFPTKNEKVVYETISVPMPVYVDVTYEITLRTRYQQQMNELTQPFINKTGAINYFLIKREGHRFEAFMQQDFVQNNTNGELAEEERKFETMIEIKVMAYLLGLGANKEQPKLVKRENAVEIKIPRERVIFQDDPEHTDVQSYIGIGGLGGTYKKRLI